MKDLQTARGTRDIDPEEMIIREKLIQKLKNVFEKYGFNPLETPIIERFDVLSVKFGAGSDSDAMKEIFKFKDQGNRELGLRFELTLSMCRYIAMNPNLKMPFKRYEIGKVYRDGPIKLGRMREFYQCDVDVVGIPNVIADAEIIKLALDVFSELDLDAYIEINNRKLLNAILEYSKIEESKRLNAIIIIDKLNKIGEKGVEEELLKLDINKDSIKKVLDIFKIDDLEEIKNLLEKEQINKNNIEGINELKDFFSYFNNNEIKKLKFNPSLARGLSYYTGIIFEGFLKNSQITSSICGGGRYDKMIAMLLDKNENIPATGISFGLVPIMEALKEKLKDKEEKEQKSVVKVFVIPIKTQKKAFEITQELRKNKINADFDLLDRGISKNLDYANSLNIPYVLFVGEKELKENKLKLRDMKTGKEETLSLNEVMKKLQSCN
ncbi:MAG: histidine--tRNA ligase [Candidatus Woesearchaeota archaeon]